MDNLQLLAELIDENFKANARIYACIIGIIIAAILAIGLTVDKRTHNPKCLVISVPLIIWIISCTCIIFFGTERIDKETFEVRKAALCEDIYKDISSRNLRWYHPDAVNTVTRHCDKDRLVKLLDAIDSLPGLKAPKAD